MSAREKAIKHAEWRFAGECEDLALRLGQLSADDLTRIARRAQTAAIYIYNVAIDAVCDGEGNWRFS